MVCRSSFEDVYGLVEQLNEECIQRCYQCVMSSAQDHDIQGRMIAVLSAEMCMRVMSISQEHGIQGRLIVVISENG